MTVALALVFALALVAIGCESTAPPSPTPAPPAATPGPVTTLSPSPSASLQPTGPTPAPSGFAFDAESVILYYASRGYTCTDPQPSAHAADHLFRSCQLVDPDGRTLVVGLVTDPAGDLADGFASVEGAESETFLEPVVALEPLAGFLGAMLGETRGEDLLPWLAGHLGDAYAETSVGTLKVATYRESETDHSRLYVEVATPGYLESPTPAPR